MATGLLSLKWNNHKSTFFHVLSTIRSKESYCDVTLACDGRFYSLHKFVLSTCSEYFEEMFERTQCKHPVIVLKDIKYDDLEALLNYMYVGEVNVVQEKLAGLIKAAECLKIKGLAVPDEDPMDSKDGSRLGREQHKRSQRTEDSPRAKRRRRENSSDLVNDVLPPVRTRTSARSRDDQIVMLNKSNAAFSENVLDDDEDKCHDNLHLKNENSSGNSKKEMDSSTNISNSSQFLSTQEKENVPEEVTLDDDVKTEPVDVEHEGEIEEDNKDSLQQELGFDASDSIGGDESYVDVDPSMLGDQNQSVEDVVNQVLPGSSGFQGNSFQMWEGEGSLSSFPVEGFSGDNSQARQMVATLRPPPAPQPPVVGGWLGIADHPAVKNPNFSSDSDKPKPHPCHICSYRARQKDHLENHMRTHTGEKPFECDQCHFKFSQRGNLQRHMKTHEVSKRLWACMVCGANFTSPSSFERHRLIHTT